MGDKKKEQEIRVLESHVSNYDKKPSEGSRPSSQKKEK